MQSLNSFSKTRLGWLLLLLSIIFFESSALFFEHVMNLPPCVMCIYERVAMIGIGIAAIIGLLAPKNGILRWIGLLGWGYSAYRGLALAYQHVGFQFEPSPFATCDLFVSFPSWAPLNHWVPWMFEAYGDCAKVEWTFLDLSMPQWLVIIFAANVIIWTIMVIAQFFGKKR
jgi:disulfide bond formation protein DsbB